MMVKKIPVLWNDGIYGEKVEVAIQDIPKTAFKRYLSRYRRKAKLGQNVRYFKLDIGMATIIFMEEERDDVDYNKLDGRYKGNFH